VDSDGSARHAREAALELAARALARRDLSRRALDSRLRKAGVAQELSAETVEELAADRLVDDSRLATGRAAVLAERGLGDAAIDARLAADGIDEPERREAVAGLAPEQERARRLVAKLGGGSEKVAAGLYRRGFGPDAIEAALAALDDGSGAELR
jgi:SOS response regulatory protein OraA/RecX